MFDYFAEHEEQDFWINNQQETVVFDETSWLTIHYTNENSIKKINKNILKFFTEQMHTM